MGAKTGWDAGLSPSLKGNCVAAPGAVAVVNGRDVDTVASQSVRFLLSWPSALVFWADITSTPPSLPQTVFNPQCSLRYSPPDSWAGSAQSLHVAAPCGLAILPVVSYESNPTSRSLPANSERVALVQIFHYPKHLGCLGVRGCDVVMGPGSAGPINV